MQYGVFRYGRSIGVTAILTPSRAWAGLEPWTPSPCLGGYGAIDTLAVPGSGAMDTQPCLGLEPWTPLPCLGGSGAIDTLAVPGRVWSH